MGVHAMTLDLLHLTPVMTRHGQIDDSREDVWSGGLKENASTLRDDKALLLPGV
jgi:hypothetical protein